MPDSFPDFKPTIRSYLKERFGPEARILDVGPGRGTFGSLLRWDFAFVDAVEAHEPYVEEFGLRDIYHDVFVADVRQFDCDDYDVVIMGDVLEHLPVEDAQGLLARIPGTLIVQVPWLYDQSDHPVSWEFHYQPDLTWDVFSIRYPSMETLAQNERCGVFVREEAACAV